MQVQMRSDDSSKWGQGFGNGADGIQTISSNTTDTPTKTTFSGSSNALTGTVGSETGFAVGNIVMIHQSRNGGAGAGTWMLNYIVGIAGTTFTFVYPLVANFDTTAIIQKIPQYSAFTISSGMTLTAAGYDGSTGGIFAVFCNGSISIQGTLDFYRAGYRGGSGNVVDNGGGYRGEGINGDNTTLINTRSGNAGGGGLGNTGAGSYLVAGSGGNGNSGQEAELNPGSSGETAGNADLTVAVFGGAAGGGGTNAGGAAGARGGKGGNGGGFGLLVGRSITITGLVNFKGENGLNGTGNSTANGSGGAGGSCLFKGLNIAIGTNLVTGSGGVDGGGPGTKGATGGEGRFHADYGKTFSGSTDITAYTTTILDRSLLDQPSVQIIG